MVKNSEKTKWADFLLWVNILLRFPPVYIAEIQMVWLGSIILNEGHTFENPSASQFESCLYCRAKVHYTFAFAKNYTDRGVMGHYIA